MFITIDGGTTNTRISLVSDYKILQTIKISMGAGACILGTAALKNEIRSSIKKLLEDNGIGEKSVDRIIASGMITSEYGLCPLEHITIPAGITELHNTMYEAVLEDVSEIPFVFIRGVKMIGKTLDKADVMRGEETELIGILKEGDAVYVLPGSHSKIIYVENNKISEFSTMMTGEMIASLSQNTLLKASVDLEKSNAVDEYVFKGYEYCSENGINMALFKVRVLDMIFKCSKDEIYSFFMGVVLCDEIKTILKADSDKIIVGGNNRIKEIMGKILKKYSEKNIIVLKEEEVLKSTSIGAVKIYDAK